MSKSNQPFKHLAVPTSSLNLNLKTTSIIAQKSDQKKMITYKQIPKLVVNSFDDTFKYRN